MKSVDCVVYLLSLFVIINDVAAFSGSSFTGSSLSISTSNRSMLTMEYIPSGLSKEQWAKMKEAEKKKTQDWQKSGGKNLFPVDPKTVKDKKDLPYMQRPGGSADDEDLKKNSFFSFNKKKPAKAEAAPEPPKTNWWTL